MIIVLVSCYKRFHFHSDYGARYEKTETLEEYVGSAKSPWHLDYSWSQEAKELRELAVKSPWLIDDKFVLGYFKTLRIVNKNVSRRFSSSRKCNRKPIHCMLCMFLYAWKSKSKHNWFINNFDDCLFYKISLDYLANTNVLQHRGMKVLNLCSLKKNLWPFTTETLTRALWNNTLS